MSSISIFWNRWSDLNLEFNNDAWEKKVVKIFKALSVMEKHKKEEPFFSKSFEELATFLKDSKRDNSPDPYSQSYNFGKSELSKFSIQDVSVI